MQTFLHINQTNLVFKSKMKDSNTNHFYSQLLIKNNYTKPIAYKV